MKEFRWNDWNLEHTAKHGVSVNEIEDVIAAATAPFPVYMGDEKWLVWGRGSGGRYLQVIYVVDDDEVTLYPIHARPLTEREKKKFRKRTGKR